MSWYPKELVICPQCHARHSTPIDCAEHRKNCQVHRNPDGSVIAKVGTHSSEAIKVTRGVIRHGNRIHFVRSNGAKCVGIVSHINEAATFIELM